ncbi:tetratricopeptide repeat protein [Ferruginibacter paludis]|uniref:tetratricopeptide repeat protein n=1 Tax=Ferruginibacter paludis TaxID=1310417 RepID=UPI0025B5CDC0|nr:tetratricopeptide repeat protein [Ferruginibacter paludis]MDN3654543.1 tetratricopeptide repeat protein [Ferruginibacter paludis]
MKSGVLLLAVLMLSVNLKAQTIDQGKTLLYYEKYKSAKAAFEKLVAANPNDVDAVYWLGQTMIMPDDKTAKDVADAKALYQKTLLANSNSPLLLAGIGHIELLEGKDQDARNHFETAISLSQSKSVPVLNAVGFANVNAKDGDAAYAIDKLKIATAVKKMNDPDVYVNLGDAYKKTGDGGQAQIAYEAALALNPKYARASYRIGKIYQTQGANQEEIYMKYYNEAIAKDPAYAPVYENLYNLYYTTDVPKSAQYLDKFLANTDDNPKNCYLRASILYAQALFADALKKADECIGSDPAPYPKLFGIKAYAYNKLKDSVNAKASFEKYFQAADTSIIGMGDYSTYASVLLKFPGNDSIAGKYVDKAVALDTLETNKVNYLKSMAASYEAQKKYKEAADWYSKVISVKRAPGKVDLYNAGFNYFRVASYDAAINVFNQYSQKYPDDAFGYYMAAKSKWGIDSTMAQALANADFEKTISVGMVDSVKYKPQVIGSYKYFVAYYANVKKDNAKAIEYCDKILSLDPADAEAASNKEALQKPARPAAPPKTPAKPAKPAKKN